MVATQGIRLHALLEQAGVRPMQPPGADPEIRGVRLDSRRVDEGDLFFALKGFRTDGERFVPQALERGAAAIVAASPRPESLSAEVAWVHVEDPRRVAGRLSRICYGKPDEAMVLVGITGTNGKTTVVFFLESIAAAAGRPVGRIGTVSNAIDGVEVPAALTTPEAPEFFALLSQMRDRAIDVVAMEVSSHALELSRVDGAHFRVAAFLNLGRDHLDQRDGREVQHIKKSNSSNHPPSRRHRRAFKRSPKRA